MSEHSRPLSLRPPRLSSPSEATTGSDGTFNLPTLRGGIYKIIAVKQGFIPAIQTLVPTGAKHKLALKLETASSWHSNVEHQARRVGDVGASEGDRWLLIGRRSTRR